MKISNATIRKIILEEIQKIQEEIYGNMSFLYHRSFTQPEKFIQLINSDKFDPGGGGGAVYGKGLYTVYDLKKTIGDWRTNRWGNFIYKMKQNLNGFICFDAAACKKVYGKNISPYEQMVKGGMKNDADKIVKKLQQQLQRQKKMYADRDMRFDEENHFAVLDLKGFIQPPQEDSTSYSVDLVSSMRDYFLGRVPGMIYTDRESGPVALVLDTSNTVVVGVASSPEDLNNVKFIPIDKIKDAETLKYKTPKSDRFNVKQSIELKFKDLDPFIVGIKEDGSATVTLDVHFGGQRPEKEEFVLKPDLSKEDAVRKLKTMTKREGQKWLENNKVSSQTSPGSIVS